MNADIESAGAMVTAGLVAHEIERGGGAPATARGDAEHGAACANCGTALAGSFCHACGQRSHVHRSLLHLGEEFLHGILHFDTKGWRTMPLLVARPGELTRRYIDGQRTRFVSPLALFLFMVFFLFFVASYTSKGNVVIEPVDANDRVVAERELGAARARLQDRLAGAASADAVAEARAELAIVEGTAAMLGVASAAPDAAIVTGIGPIDAAIAHATRNPDYAIYKLKNTAYKFSFLLVPITLPFLWLMFFWRPGVTMYDHAVFSLYSMSFMSLLFATVFLLKFAGLDSAVAALLFIAPPLHMFLQVRGTYGLGHVQALWRTAVLVAVAGTVFMLYLLLILYLSMQ